MPVQTRCKDYMGKQTQIKPRFRAILVDWLCLVHNKWRRHGIEMSTLYLAVHLVDKFLGKVDLPKNDLQLLGVTSACGCASVAPVGVDRPEAVPRVRVRVRVRAVAVFYLASKFEDVHPAVARDLVAVSASAFTRQELLDFEVRALQVLDFQVGVRSACVACFGPIGIGAATDAGVDGV